MISYLSDMDGVLIKEGEMIPGADVFIQTLRGWGIDDDSQVIRTYHAMNGTGLPR